MLNGLIHAHSGLRWIVLILLLAAIFKSLMKWRSNVNYSEGDRKINLFAMVSMHVQLLLGLALFSMSGRVDFSQMKDAMYRFFTVEHTTMMLIAIILVTIGHAKSKKATDDAKKHKTIFTFYLIALLLVLAAIPWPFRGWGNGWF
jgi:uncharacterized membrane protein